MTSLVHHCPLICQETPLGLVGRADAAVTAVSIIDDMNYSPDDRTAVLTIRVWMESDRPSGFRARITQSLDISTSEQVMSAAASVGEVVAMVNWWLDAFIAGYTQPKQP